jgi:hypothetical protein
MFNKIVLLMLVILLVVAVSKDKIQLGGAKKSIFSKTTLVKVRAQAAVSRASAQDNEDPYAWIRPMYIIDIFRKFWLTR